MTDDKRFTIKTQDDYFGITDNNTVDKVNVINGIHTEIEAEWLCDLLNELHEENEQLREHFIYLIGTALEDKECRKIYAKGLIEIFDDCANLDEAKIKIKEYLDD